MDEKELLKKIKDLTAKQIEELKKTLEEKGELNEKALEIIEGKIKEQLKSTATSDELQTLTKTVSDLKASFDADKEQSKGKIDEGLRKYIEENSEVLKALKNGESKKFDITVKATAGATDITGRDAYATILPGNVEVPVRAARILPLFKTKKVSSEFIKYRETNVVTRDGDFVIACATSASNTAKSWQVITIELAKVRDLMDACMDMLDDYDWVESELKALIEESILLKIDFELLLGAAAAATDLNSIDNIASEFNPANVLADFSLATGTPFQDANLEQLVDAMAAQISIFGQENAWMADTLVMNFKDFVNYRNLKDANGNKLMHTLSDTVATIAGLRIVTSPIVVPDTCFVFDSTRGEILDRQETRLRTSFENNDNIEHEIVTFVATRRLQFHVASNDADAFMKCSGIAAAIVLITAP